MIRAKFLRQVKAPRTSATRRQIRAVPTDAAAPSGAPEGWGTTQRVHNSPVMSRRELLIFAAMVTVTTLAILKYTVWWVGHIPRPASGQIPAFLLDLALFGALTFLVWHGIFVRLGHWYAVA
ncbi:MAG: hypothetical protein M3P51_18940 [Chloroflexota bacterium]|nr:hypothetical protein [Chloroflexota bacterium]